MRERTVLAIEITPKLRKKLQKFCKQNDVTQKEFVTIAIENELDSY